MIKKWDIVNLVVEFILIILVCVFTFLSFEYKKEWLHVISDIINGFTIGYNIALI
jgi:hypothetical protein